MKTVFSVVLCVLLLLGTGVMTVSADSDTITAIAFDNASAVAEENLSLSGYGDKESGYAASTVGGRLYASVSGTDLRKLEWSKGEYGAEGLQPVMTGGTKNPWGSGAYLELRTSTAGYEDIAFSAQLGATNKGPCDYKLQYSVDGVTFRDVAGAFFSVTTNKTLFQAFDKTALPADADNADTLVIRITVASNRMVNGTAGLIGSTGGETAINHMAVYGTPLPVSTTAAETTSTGGTATTTAMSSDTTASQTAVTTTVKAGAETFPNVDTGEEDVLWLVQTAMAVGVSAAVLCVAARRRKAT
ncbi:MAG: hypothetical protein IJD01_04630 [Clostridia bacterium]|nr:hypothetical protein [Clostridia bacterium]